MLLPDSVIIREPIKKHFLTIIFEDNDDVYSCIRQSIIENNLNKCFVEDCSGIIKNGLVNCFSGNCFKKIDFCEKEISIASGEFKLNNKKELFGNLKIITKERKPIQGTLVKGIAKNNLKIILGFFK